MPAYRMTMTPARRAAFARQAVARFDRGEARMYEAARKTMNAWLDWLRANFEQSITAAVGQPGSGKPPPNQTEIDIRKIADALDKMTQGTVDPITPDPFVPIEIDPATGKAIPEDPTAPPPATSMNVATIIDHLREFLEGAESLAVFEHEAERYMIPAIQKELDPIIRQGFENPQVKHALTNWRNKWLVDRKQALVGIPEQVSSQFRTRIAAVGAMRGTTVDDVAEVVHEMLGNGYPSWEGRERLIARTETVGANNQGSLAAMTEIAKAEGVEHATKTWLATDDTKTRPDHAAADGQTVPLGGKFQVGDVEMNGPGDNAGGAAEVCNCRCTLTYDFGEQALAASSFAYNPDQPRDEHGRFGSGGDDAGAKTEPDGFPSQSAGVLRGGDASMLLNEARAGGFTYDVAGRSSPKTGYSVSPYPDRTRVIDTKDLTADSISQYAKDNADVLAQPGAHLGGWRETKPDGTDRTWLDVSLVSQSKSAATALAREHNQVAIFDLKAGDTIDTGGTGGYGSKARFGQEHRAGSPGPTRGPPGQAAAGEPAADGQGTEGQAEAEVAPPMSGVAIMAVLAESDVARFTVPGADPPDAPGFHVTLGYLANDAASYTDEEKSGLVSVLAGAGDLLPATADVFGQAVLNDDDGERDPALVALVQSDGLAALHDHVAGVLSDLRIEQSTTFPIWLAHLTLGYNLTAEQFPDGLVGSSITLDRVVIGWGDELIDATSPDPRGDDATEVLTSATEEPTVTAPSTAPSATGGDTPAPSFEDSIEPSGVTWSGPVALLDTPSSDYRVVSSTGGTIRPLPQPLSYQRQSGEEHANSVVVGRVLAVEQRGNMLWASGDYMDPMINFDVEQAMAQVDAGMGYTSVDLAVQVFGYSDVDGNPLDPSQADGSAPICEVALQWEFGGVTILSFAAFADARITNEVPDLEAPTTGGDGTMPAPAGGKATFAAATPEAPTVSDDGKTITLADGSAIGVGDSVSYPDPDGDSDTETGVITAIDPDAQTVTVTPVPDPGGEQDPDRTVAIANLIGVPPDAGKPGMDGDAAILASSEIRPYKAAAFAKRDLDGPTPLTVDPVTREVYGHLATFDTCHMGKLEEGRCVQAPRAPGGDYSYFHLAPVTTDEGLLDVGKITLGAGHAGPRGGFRGAVAHYDNSANAVAVVRAYEDDFGIQVAGQLIHDVSGADVEALQRSPLSGDWRKVSGEYRLCAALAVNSPGFPIIRRPRVEAGMVGREQVSLVAAGIVDRPETKFTGEISLPSGRTISREDFESMTAAMVEAIERQKPAPIPDELQQRRMRARLALRARRGA